MSKFLKRNLKLHMNPNKVFIKTLSSGIDFLGWVHFPYRRVLRTSTKRRMFRKIKNNFKYQSLSSYAGLLRHGNCYEVKSELLKAVEKNGR